MTRFGNTSRAVGASCSLRMNALAAGMCTVAFDLSASALLAGQGWSASFARRSTDGHFRRDV